MTERISPEMLLRFSGYGPRYTSYPTAPEWVSSVSSKQLNVSIAGLSGPVSAYVHIPFCREQCTFCGCNMVVAGRTDAGTRYLDALERRIDALPLPSLKVPTARIHLGGGTPTWLTCEQMDRLFGLLYSRFELVSGAEVSVEADPEVTTDQHLSLIHISEPTRPY